MVLGDLRGSDEGHGGIVLDAQHHRGVPHVSHERAVAADHHHTGRGARGAGEARQSLRPLRCGGELKYKSQTTHTEKHYKKTMNMKRMINIKCVIIKG